jgi:hypothetical protein
MLFQLFQKMDDMPSLFFLSYGGMPIGVILSISEKTVQQFTESQIIY